ncbi:MAG: Lrp/AsnC family transcriptional regulator [Thermoplasmatales archaeon]|nr:Lrp/AsnC family transcriptional regulator [Thermoplasmatales archaeon]
MSDKMMDQIDVKILRMLQQDARTPFKVIAEQCNVSTDTIKNRFNSLKKKGIIRHSTIVIDPKKIGLGNIVLFGIRAVERYSDSVINMIKKIPGICVVTRAIGEYDIEAILILKDIEHIGTTKEIIEDDPQVKSVNVDIFVDKPLLCPKNFEFE